MTDTSPSIEARIRRLEDRQELWDLVARYCVLADERNFAAVVELFVDEGRFQSPRGWAEGREAVMGYFIDRFPVYGPGFHYPHSQLVTFDDDDHAHGIVPSHAEMSIDGQTLWSAYHYVDRYVRRDGRWRFAERAIDMLYLVPLSELPTALGEPLRRRWPGMPPGGTELPEGTAAWQAFHAEYGRD